VFKLIFKIFGGLIIVTLLLGLGTFAYLGSFYSVQKSTNVYDCAVVFGAAVWPGGTPSDALNDRVNTAVDIYNEERVSCLIFSGADSAYGKHEVDVMVDIAYSREVELEDIELDYDGNNTRQTIENLDNERSYVLVSNDFHLARINLLAKQRKLKDYSVEYSLYANGRYSKEAFFVVREIAAFWYYALGA